MKKWAVLISGTRRCGRAVGLAFSVSGCSSDYVMATKDGRMILTDGKPTVDDDTGRSHRFWALISYEDQQGNKMQINRDDVFPPEVMGAQIIKR
ncbi:YgdI/YgdR family lipoprotein [Klebsiella pneumoniae]|uniref:YgdI/YgdR family lipoprotein n=1 Tax=Klebsiella pneumoniae TaxID=573 RepID=UPI003986B04E